MIKLSYTTMSTLYEFPHSWLNKMMGVKKDFPPEVLEAFAKGKEIHRIIQDHVAGIKEDERVAKFVERKFPVVEVVDFDKNCEINVPIDDKYSLYGYFDGWNPETKTLLEIKTGKTLWSTAKFANSIQRKLYALGMPEAKETLLISVHSDISLWDRIKPKKILIPLTEKDREEALEYVKGAIKIIESGDLMSDLEDGVCTHYRCPYGHNCRFKK